LKDSIVGLPSANQDVYRWYPAPAKLSFGEGRALSMRPYEVALLQLVPKGSKPSLGRTFSAEDAARGFAEKTRQIPVSVHVDAPNVVAHWSPLKGRSANSKLGATLMVLKDGSILAKGTNPSNDVYTLETTADGEMTGLLLETLVDPSLPGNGPGRAENGNFALTGFRVEADGREVAIAAASADFSQTTFGGWPVSAAIDEDLKSGWSIHPLVGEPHAAVFQFTRPIARGTKLAITLSCGERGHSLGRFRISATADARPELPSNYRPGSATLSTVIPATRTGGLLLLIGGTQDDAPVGRIAESPLPLESVWAARSNWACPWTAWRGEIGSSAQSRAITVRLSRRRSKAAANFTAYFLPK
jgi:hypothetical protein